jgi:tetratricopeptide (TPR) repeat protein
LHSHYREGRAWLEEALSANPNDRSPETARALWALSMILSWSGDAGSRPMAEKSLELWRENSEPLELALALESIGYSQFMANEYDKALRSMEDCLEQYRKFGSEKLVTRGRVSVGQVPRSTR